MPPDAPQPPNRAATVVLRDENDSQRSSNLHNASTCAACKDGVQPWTPARRAAAASYAARSGRRIMDLPLSGEVTS